MTSDIKIIKQGKIGTRQQTCYNCEAILAIPSDKEEFICPCCHTKQTVNTKQPIEFIKENKNDKRLHTNYATDDDCLKDSRRDEGSTEDWNA